MDKPTQYKMIMHYRTSNAFLNIFQKKKHRS